MTQRMTDVELELWLAAERAMDEYRYEWTERLGGTRVDAVRAAFAADDAVELVHDLASKYPSLYEQLDLWIDLLLRCPDVEKRWAGIREYREAHRVKARA